MSRFLGALLFLAFAVGFGNKSVAACDVVKAAWYTMPESRVTLRSDHDVTHDLLVKIATTPAEREQGFQDICTEWVQAWGILFIFPTSQRHGFHMQNVKESLDIAFIAEDGQILELMKMAKEGNRGGGRTYRAAQSYRYALEVAAGRLSGLGLDEGDWWLTLDPIWK